MVDRLHADRKDEQSPCIFAAKNNSATVCRAAKRDKRAHIALPKRELWDYGMDGLEPVVGATRSCSGKISPVRNRVRSWQRRRHGSSLLVVCSVLSGLSGLVCLVCLVFSFSCVQVLVFLCSGVQVRCSGFLVFLCSLFLLLSLISFATPRCSYTQAACPLVTHCSCQRLDGGQVQTSQVWKEPVRRGAALVQERSHSALQRTKR